MTTGTQWHGAVGDVWAAEWARTDRSFAGLSPHLDAAILAAAPAGGGRAVDLGCGAGQTSIALAAARPDIKVTGVDVSAALVAKARERGADLGNLDFLVEDVSARPKVAAQADLLVSRHGVMFFDAPDDVFASLHAAVGPQARLVFSCFRSPALNPWAAGLVAAMTGGVPAAPAGYAPGPFGFADPDRTASMLAAADWRGAVPTAIDYDYVAGAGDDPVADAVSFLCRVGPVAAAIGAAPDDVRVAMIDRLRAALAEHRDDDRVRFPAAAWIWTAHA